jgi:uncharacterized protein (DUF2236 family)
MIRRISQEALGLLGGGRAILLQLAHPLVAAGVADHSDFQTDPLARLLRTLELIHTLVFGSRWQAQKALQRFHTMHTRIQGCLSHAAGRFPAGTFYTASDLELKLWVHATLVETRLMTYERFVAPLTPGERRRYYADTRVLARLLGVPDQVPPPTWEDFQRYMANILASDTLAVTDTARRLARDVLNPSRVGIVPSASARLVRFVTAGLLPERFRVAYGLGWGVGQQILLDNLSRTTRRLRPLVPEWVWQNPLLNGGLPRRLLWGATESGEGASD